MSKPYKWTLRVTVEVDPVWVADGFNLANPACADSLREAIENAILDYASPDEKRVTLTVTKAPEPSRIMREQGYLATAGA